jgi:hypothetical protein
MIFIKVYKSKIIWPSPKVSVEIKNLNKINKFTTIIQIFIKEDNKKTKILSIL